MPIPPSRPEPTPYLRGRVPLPPADSDTPVAYCMYGCEVNGVFAIDKPQGVVPPRLSCYVNFAFSPAEAGNYYKRIIILYKNQSPKAIDLIGSGYTEKRRPAPLQYKHVVEHYARERRGTHRLSPEERQAAADERQAAEAAGDEVESVAAFSLADFANEAWLMRDLFNGSTAQSRAVALDADLIDFAAGSRLRPTEPRTVRLINRTSGKLSVQWIVPTGYSKGSPADAIAPVFVVSPLTCDVLPYETATFRVQFRPQSDQQCAPPKLEAPRLPKQRAPPALDLSHGTCIHT